MTEVQQRVAARLSADGARYAGLDRVGKRLRTQTLVNEELESWVNHRAQLGLPTLSDTDEDTLVAAVHAALGGLGPLEPLLARTDIEDIFFTGTAPTMLRLADGRKVPVRGWRTPMCSWRSCCSRWRPRRWMTPPGGSSPFRGRCCSCG